MFRSTGRIGNESSASRKLILRVGQRSNYARQLHDLNVGGTLVPVVPPADDYVATGCRMSVAEEILALEFKFDAHALPSLRSDLALGLAIGETLLHRFDIVAKFVRQHSKEEHDALLIHGFM